MGSDTQHIYGAEHTDLKLAVIWEYLQAYTRVLKNQNWAKTLYLDPFAGTGYRDLRRLPSIESADGNAPLFSSPPEQQQPPPSV